MKYTVLVFFLLSFSLGAYPWGQNGHRAIAQLAQNHLNENAKKKVQEILGTASLAQVSTWADFIKADPQWDKTQYYHYVSVPEGKNLKTMEHGPKGDILTAIQEFTKKLKDPKASKEEKAVALKFLVHLVADIHQPLHVGRVGDEGGGLLFVKWFGKMKNIHEVWDDEIIASERLSFSEYAQFLDHADEASLKNWQKSSPEDWAQESFELRDKIFEAAKKSQRKPLSYPYVYEHLGTLNQRLLMAGIRLAGWLNTQL